MQTAANAVMKYVDRLDAFVKFRVFTPEQVEEFLRGVHGSDRSSYVSRIVEKCVAWLPEKAQRAVGSDANPSDGIREVLYEAAIGLNPGLDIRRVLLPAGGKAAPARQPKRKTAWRRDARRLREELSRRVVGQAAAVATVAAAVERARVGLRDPDRPLGAFLFVGPTGVGKTELARALADALADPHRKGLVRIDCSEYGQPHEYAKLIGAPPGYVGFEQGGYLTNVMAEAEAGVVLFDEIEKADERVHNLLLQIMDEGYCTDAKGQRIDFTNSLIILTSNLGAVECEALERRLGFGMAQRRGLGHAERAEATRQALGQRFKPEFLNRIDETVVFRSLDLEDAARIVDKFAGQLDERARPRGLRLELGAAARRWLVKAGFSDDFGARELRRCIQRYVENPLAEALLNGRLPRRGRIVVECDAHGLSFRELAAARATQGAGAARRRAQSATDGRAAALSQPQDRASA